MKSQIKIIILLFYCCISGNALLGKPITNYKMEITQKSISNFQVKLDILLKDNYCSGDTITISFGGIFFEEEGESFDAVQNLVIKSKKKIPFIFDRKTSEIKICKKDITQNKISLEYGFYFIMNVSRDTTVTLFYNGMEKPIPVIKNIDNVHYSAKIKTLKNFICLSNISNKSKYTDIQNVAFCFVDTSHITQKHFETKYCDVNIFVRNGIFAENDFNILKKKMRDCFDYFSNNINPYSFKNFNLVEWDSWSGSTYLGSVACVHKSDFKTYTLFHEIAHEWIGRQVKIKDKSKGEYLLKESLNDYLTVQFLKYEEGDSLYQVQIKNYIDGYNEYLAQNENISIWDVAKYVHSTHAIIMYKQVILLDELAQKVGYDKLNSVIFDFLRKSIGKEIEITQFLNLLKEKFGNPAIDYCTKI